MLKAFRLFFVMLLCNLATVKAQVNWNQYPSVSFAPELYTNHPDVVIADEHTEITYRGRFSVIKRFVTYCVRSQEGARALSTMSLPENFDPAYSKLMFKHGRTELNSGVDLYSFKVKKFAARMLKDGVWRELTTDYKFVKRRWLKSNGEIVNDEMPTYTLSGISEGSFLQVCYEAEFDGYYGEDIYYFYHTKYLKHRASFDFAYYIHKRYSKLNCSVLLNVPDSCVKFNQQFNEDQVIRKTTITLHNIQPINYPQNALELETQPHIVIDLEYGLISPYAINSLATELAFVRKLSDFGWTVSVDTTTDYQKLNTGRNEDLRKFYRKLPPLRPDTSCLPFLKAYRDTITSYRYLSQEQLYYNEDHLLNISTIAHFSRRRYPPNGAAILPQILYDKEIPFSIANVIDKRYGNHSPKIRAHEPYERTILVIPDGNTMHFYMSRGWGSKYFIDELPFYLEGRIAAVRAITFDKRDSLKTDKILKFIKTKQSTENDNTRVENANFTVDSDNKSVQYAGRVSLSGQYSTLLRPLYLKDPIDSSVSKSYFKKCSEKPGATEIQLRATSRSSDFPFRHNFACNEKIALANTETLNMRDWFSFSLNRQLLPQTPSSDYYFDFVFTDVYNFVITFARHTEISNLEEFNKTISNKYFEYSANMEKQEGNSYFVKVSLQLKTIGVRIEDVALLEELLQALDKTNNFQAKLKAL